MIRKKNILYTALIFILTILLITGCGKNKKNIELGMTKQEVMNILGDPTVTDEDDCLWLGSAEKKYKEVENLLEKAFENDDEAAFIKAEKIYKELEEMSFSFRYCSFANNKLEEYFYDKNHKFDEDNYYISQKMKTIEKVDINLKNYDIYIDERKDFGERFVFFERISYTTTFTDGSIYKSYCKNYEFLGSTQYINDYSIGITWSDYFSQKYELKDGKYHYTIIGCNSIGEIDSNGKVKFWTGGSNLIPTNITGLSDNYYYELPNEELTLFNNGYYYGDENNPYQLFVRPVDKSLGNITINGNTERIIDYAFFECTNLDNIVIPNSVKSIGCCAFAECSNLKDITISNNVESIGYSAFALCSSLEKIILPNKLEIIGDSLFFECSKLRSVTIPNSVKTIKYYSFTGCINLKSLIIPTSVTTIEISAFENCEQLSVFCLENNNYFFRDDEIEATVYYYRESQPMDFGNYWHYDENNNIVIWD
ncbi:MAG: leucine-rich repeat domain-containing protein [Acholeplasmatales bacterium]|nr:leucine-rich repeat domain-containing protein [Acholeplasmatales bacterium]